MKKRSIWESLGNLYTENHHGEKKEADKEDTRKDASHLVLKSRNQGWEPDTQRLGGKGAGERHTERTGIERRSRERGVPDKALMKTWV